MTLRADIKRIDPGDIAGFKAATDLAWRTFLKFEAPVYPQEGTESFRVFLADRGLQKMFEAGEYILYGAFLDNELVGMATVRDIWHISLLFVEERYHKIGIGRELIYALRDMEKAMGNDKLTVNSSPYATGFYHRLGFVDTDIARQKEGIIFTSMIWNF